MLQTIAAIKAYSYYQEQPVEETVILNSDEFRMTLKNISKAQEMSDQARTAETPIIITEVDTLNLKKL